MEATSSSGVGSPESCLDYSFGLDNPNFSDRTLLLEIIDEPKTCWLCLEFLQFVKKRIFKPDPDDKVLATTTTPRVKTIQISSLILAASSPFFLKLFSNGMRESEQRQVTLQIEAQEEVSFMDLLNYVYSNKLPATLFPSLDLLKTADKFEVASCLRDCSLSLLSLPMTLESASLYLDLPPSLLKSHTTKPLIDAAKQFLVAQFKDVERFKEEVLELPLAGIEAILSSDDLRVASEGVVYDLALMWARKHYPTLEKRRGVLTTHLLHLIRFPLMTTSKLIEQVLTCTDIDREFASKIVIRALHFKSETSHRQRCIAAADGNRQFVERAYTFRPVKVVHFELPPYQQQCCTVYLDLKLEEVMDIFPDGRISSKTFHLGGQIFTLTGYVFLKSTSALYFGLSLIMQAAAYTVVNYDVAVRKKPSQEFVSSRRGSNTFTEGPGSIKKLLDVEWTSFVADNSHYFINGILHLRADLKIIDSIDSNG